MAVRRCSIPGDAQCGRVLLVDLTGQPFRGGLTEVDRVVEPTDGEQGVGAGTGGGGQ